MSNLSNILIQVGLMMIIAGLIIKFFPQKIPILPGDILYKKDNFTFYFPIATSIIISLLITLIINFFK